MMFVCSVYWNMQTHIHTKYACTFSFPFLYFHLVTNPFQMLSNYSGSYNEQAIAYKMYMNKLRPIRWSISCTFSITNNSLSACTKGECARLWNGTSTQSWQLKLKMHAKQTNKQTAQTGKRISRTKPIVIYNETSTSEWLTSNVWHSVLSIVRK